MKIQIEKEITLDDVEGIIVTALEGGSNYWYWVKTEDFKDDLPDPGKPITLRISKAIYKDPSFRMPVYDVEDKDEVLGILSQKSFKEGLELAAKDYPDRLDAIFNESYDAIDADVIFQLCVMQDVVFG